jgi:hypothetical protein
MKICSKGTGRQRLSYPPERPWVLTWCPGEDSNLHAVKAQASETCVSTNSTTWAFRRKGSITPGPAEAASRKGGEAAAVPGVGESRDMHAP